MSRAPAAAARGHERAAEGEPASPSRAPHATAEPIHAPAAERIDVPASTPLAESTAEPRAESTAEPIAVPPGYSPAFVETGSFLGLCGPIFQRPREDGRPPMLALRVLPKHLNLRGIVHGGLLVTLADSALGHAINHARNEPLGVVTVSLATDFVEAARLGDWIEAEVDVQRIGSRMAFANCYLQVGERRILRASGVFAVARSVPGARHP